MKDHSMDPSDSAFIDMIVGASRGRTEEDGAGFDRLYRMGPEKFARIVRLIDREEKIRLVRRALSLTGIVASWILGLSRLLLSGTWQSDYFFPYVGGLVGSCLLAVKWTSQTCLQYHIPRALSRLAEVGSVAPLLESLRFAGGKTRELVVANLTRLLPLMNQDTWSALTEPQRNLLCGQIKMALDATEIDFVEAVLETVSLYGDRKALPSVARIIVSEAPTGREQQVRDCARECLDRMMQRIDFGTIADIGPNVLRLNRGSENYASWDTLVDARLALISLLPLLQQPADAGVLSRKERKALHTALQLGQISPIYDFQKLGPRFVLELLSALERIGDTDALFYVRAKAYGEAATADAQQIRAAARACLKSLEARAKREQVGQTLLRASDAPEPAADTLLRPASGGDAAPSEQLLRAAIGHENETE